MHVYDVRAGFLNNIVFWRVRCYHFIFSEASHRNPDVGCYLLSCVYGLLPWKLAGGGAGTVVGQWRSLSDCFLSLWAYLGRKLPLSLC